MTKKKTKKKASKVKAAPEVKATEETLPQPKATKGKELVLVRWQHSGTETFRLVSEDKLVAIMERFSSTAWVIYTAKDSAFGLTERKSSYPDLLAKQLEDKIKKNNTYEVDKPFDFAV